MEGAASHICDDFLQQYMPLRARQRETCKGSSDNVMVPIDEFRATLDGAIRLAR